MKKETKKRAPKKSNTEKGEPAANIIAEVPIVDGEVVTQEEAPVVPPVVLKKETKKRAPKKSKVAEEEPAANIIAAETDAPVTEEGGEVPVVPPVPLKKETKKRAPKKSKPEESTANIIAAETVPVTEEGGGGGEVPVTEEGGGGGGEVPVPLKKETKKRASKKSKTEKAEDPAANIIADTDHDTNTELTEVVLPLLEQLHLGNSLSAANAKDERRILQPHNHNELSHESYNHDNDNDTDTELTEVFVNDVLFYTNHDQSLWFDSSLSPITKPF